ncbi:MAG: glycosyltransferase family 2 protein [Alphaproteobacteria bacterium]
MQINRATVSVVIPTWNRAHCISDCINSVLNQTVSADEIIVVDDGSTDNTWEILLKFEKKGIIPIWQRNSGVSVARNAGILRAKSGWVAFLDSDDCWLPDRLEVFHRDIESCSEDVGVHISNALICDSMYRLEAFKIRDYKFPQGIATKVPDPCELAITGVFTPTAVVKADWIERVGGFNTKMTIFEDLLFFTQLSLLGPWLMVGDIVVEIVRLNRDVDALSNQAITQAAYSAQQMVYLCEELLKSENLSRHHQIIFANRYSGALLHLAKVQVSNGHVKESRRTLLKAAMSHSNRCIGLIKSVIPLVFGVQGFNFILQKKESFRRIN